MLRRVIQEPLFQFLFAGALIFAVYNAVAGDATEPSDDAIVIGDA